MLKEARKVANRTQEQLAEKVRTKKVIYLYLKMENVTFSFQHFTEFLSSDSENV
jgi:hypothetical protein